jgi:hypothetical protein
LGVIAAVAAVGMLSATPASASLLEAGDRCVANDSKANWTAIVLNNGISFYPELPPLVAPEGARVIVRWKVQVGPGLAPIAQQLVAFRQVEEEEDQLVGESAVEALHEGTNEFATRIPVPEYAHVGLRGPSQTLLCDHESGHIGGIVEGPWAVGETRHFKGEVNLGVPVIAYVEPDQDGDGYGDLTQDGCPGNAAYTGPCPVTPVVALSTRSELKRKAILVTVSSTAAAPVQVFGQVRWRVRQPGPKGKVVKLSQGLNAGAELTVSPGAPVRFRVSLEESVLRRLGRIEPSQHLTANLTARATDLAGRVVQRHFKLRLPGRG